jgi:phosphoglucomutase
MTEQNCLPENPVMINTIVTSTLGDNVAESFGVSVEKTLTGFKFIGDKIKEHNAKGDKNYVFGYEESYGCLIGDFARDKDAVQASLMFCEAADYYKKQGKTLIDVLNDLFAKFGYYVDTQTSAFFRGADGSDKMNALLEEMRKNPITEAAGIKVSSVEDYLLAPPEGFVPSNVLRFNLEDGSFVAVRPSGTEPKCKVYYCVKGKDKTDAETKLAALREVFDIKA